VPYSEQVQVDARRVILMATSNNAEFTVDLANRMSCVRLLKQSPNHKFKKYPEGDLLDHVATNWPQYLGAVFTVLREWHRSGKPQLDTVDHDFRRWARTLGYITENVLKVGNLLAGNRAAQQRIASPHLAWLRELVIAIQKAGKVGCKLRTHHLLEIAINHSVVIPGIEIGVDSESDEERPKILRSLGRKLGVIFGDLNSIQIDTLRIDRLTVIDQGGHDNIREYVVFFENPEVPKVDPQLKPVSPQVPEVIQDLCRKDSLSTFNYAIQDSRSIAGLPVTSGCGDLHDIACQSACVVEGDA
jgi:hypothetical protein